MCAHKKLSLVEKEAYITSAFNDWLASVCVRNGLRAPLEVWKRGEDFEGIYEVYFADASHMRLFCHRMYETPIDADMQSHLDALYGSDDPDVKTYLKGVRPVIAVCEYATYSALVETSYETALEKRRALQTMENIGAPAQSAVPAQSTVPVQNLAATQNVANQMSMQTQNFVASMNQHNEQMNGIYQQMHKSQMQMMGFEPTHYVDGVPNYLGGPMAAANAFRN